MNHLEPRGNAAAAVPDWLTELAERVTSASPATLSRLTPPPGLPLRESAVLVLFGPGDAGAPDVLLIERAAQMRAHAGQPAFPGGGLDPEDPGPVAAALREAQEETDLDPSGVRVLGTLPAMWVPPSGYSVTPVLAWWQRPSPVRVIDPGEVARVVRVPVANLVDPANRVTVAHPSGFVGPGFTVAGLLVWGFTAGLLDRLLALAGWELPWRPGRTVNL